MKWPLPCLLLILTATRVLAGETFSEDVRRNASNATVLIVNSSQRSVGVGSGVIIKKEGGTVYILTARHVVESAANLEVRFFTSRSRPRPDSVHSKVSVIATGEGDSDLAILRIMTDKEVPAQLRLCLPKEAPREKSFPVLTVGCNGKAAPSSVESRATKRTVKLPKGEGPVTLWEVEKAQQSGRSGGPMVDKRGLLLGICSGRGDGKGYFCTVEQIQELLKKEALEYLGEE
jgi:serine protease Do